MQEAYCNDFPCPSDLVCTAQLDMLVLLDGSGSVNWYGPGFEQERSFTKKLFELMSFGETGAKAGVILFSWEAELVSPPTGRQPRGRAGARRGAADAAPELGARARQVRGGVRRQMK